MEISENEKIILRQKRRTLIQEMDKLRNEFRNNMERKEKELKQVEQEMQNKGIEVDDDEEIMKELSELDQTVRINGKRKRHEDDFYREEYMDRIGKRQRRRE